MNIVETFEHDGKVVEIYYDENPLNPRTDWDNYDTMICFHKRYNLGDKTNYTSGDFNNWEEFEYILKRDNDILEMLPIYMYDHSGITIRTTPFSCPWDSGRVGVIFITKDQARKCYGVKNITKSVKELAHKMLESSVKVYSQYLEGDVYGYIIKAKQTEEEEESGIEAEELGSCWGYFGMTEVTEEAKEAAENAKVTSKVKEDPNQMQLAL